MRNIDEGKNCFGSNYIIEQNELQFVYTTRETLTVK